MAGIRLFGRKNYQDRPRLAIPYTKPEIVIEILALVGLIAMVILAVINWNKLPQSVPTHFSFSGEVNGYGTRTDVLMFPVTGVILYGLLTIFARLPHLFNYPVAITPENAKREYLLGRAFMNMLKLILIWMFYDIFNTTVRVALGLQTQMGNLVVVFLGLILTATVLYFILSFKFAKKKA